MRVQKYISAGVLSGLMLFGIAGDAFAERWQNRHASDLNRGYVTAQSRHGNGSVDGPVRRTSKGAQVRLPGGTWEYCRRSCSETLRVETVDFWEGRQEGQVGLSQECGIFGCLDLDLSF